MMLVGKDEVASMFMPFLTVIYNNRNYQLTERLIDVNTQVLCVDIGPLLTPKKTKITVVCDGMGSDLR